MTARPAPAARPRSRGSPSSERPTRSPTRLRETAGELWEVEPGGWSSSLDGRARCSRGDEISLPRPDRQALRLPRRRDHRGRRGPPERRRYRLLRRGPALLGGLRRRRRGRDRPRDRRRSTVLRTSTIADVGKAINPQLVERQDEGATLQGIGNALFEEMRFVDGRVVNDSLLDYRIPRIARPAPRDDARSSSRTRTGPGPTAPRAAAKERSPPCPRRSSARSPTRACR